MNQKKGFSRNIIVRLVVLVVFLAALILGRRYIGTADNSTASPDSNSLLASTQTSASTQQHNTTDLLDQVVPAQMRSQILQRKGYRVSYNADNRIPNWVAWRLTSAHTHGKVLREEQNFEADYDADGPRVDTYDYSRSGYDRGHMCPAGDNKWDEEAMQQTFMLSNICPQNHSLNWVAWNDLEMQTRHWARKYGEVFVVCGPILRDVKHKTIGRHKVVVPEAFYKVILRLKPEPAALGFIYENNSSEQSMQEALVSVDEVEKITGIDFFAALDDEIEQRIEATASLSNWHISNNKYTH